jgi:hypothetical protein
MGVQENIGYRRFPKQGALLGEPVRVCFNYQAEMMISGVCVRDDAEAPFLSIFKLSDGRIVLSTECQFQAGR